MKHKLFNVVNYFTLRTYGIIKYASSIQKITVYPAIEESFGIMYGRIYFDVVLDETLFDNLDENEEREIDSYFANSSSSSGSQFVSYPLEPRRSIETKYLKSLKAFFDMYNTLSLSLTILANKSLSEKIEVNISSLDILPEFLYLNRFWNDLNFSLSAYRNVYHNFFDDDCRWNHFLFSLPKLEDSKVKPELLVSDIELFHNGIGELRWIRHLFEHYLLPVKIKGNKVVEEIWVEANQLLESLENDSDSSYGINIPLLKKILHEKLEAEIYHDYRRQKLNTFFANYPIQNHDYVLLNDYNIYVINNIHIDKNYSMQFCGQKINNDLCRGKRSSNFTLESIINYLKNDEFKTYSQKFNWKQRSLVVSWLKRKKIEIKLKNHPFYKKIKKNEKDEYWD